jgi:hypothetical protein
MQRPERTQYWRLFITAFLLSQCALASAPAVAGELKDFTSDGCSLFPDGTMKDRAKWCDCCFEHDISYWQGGAADERRTADERLRACVQERTGDKVLAETMYLGVRAGGSPAFPTWYRWAYGWPYGRGYRRLTEEERGHVRSRLDSYWVKHPKGYCWEKHSPAQPDKRSDK